MSEAIRASRARLAGLTARHGAEDPATIEAKRNHRLLSVEECIEKNLRDCPPLDAEQLSKLTAIFSTAVNRINGGGS